MNWQTRRLAAVLGLAIALAFQAETADAAVSQVQIDEVMAGAFGRPELQAIRLRVTNCAQPFAEPARLTTFDAAGNPVGEVDFPVVSLPCGFSGLIATQALANSLPFQPTFIIPPILALESGKVCFESPADDPASRLCLSYGNFTGDSQQGSPGNAPGLPTLLSCSLQRQAFFDAFGAPNFNEDFGRQTARFLIPLRFNDVLRTSPFTLPIEALFNAGITAGCGGGRFCPDELVTREQMAVFLLRAQEGASFMPPACSSQAFGDVPCASPFAPWINELAARGITGGCGGGNFCPGFPVDRAQMAVFLLLASEGPGFTPPACTAQVFGDVPCASPFAPWINELAARGITGGCGNGDFCPDNPVSREQMAAFLTAAFALPVPSFECVDDPAPDDDHGDLPNLATPIFPGMTVHGVIEAAGDRDYFSFQARAGELFALDAPVLAGPGLDIQVLAPPGADDLNFGFSRFPRLVFRIPVDGTYFVQVEGFQPKEYEFTLEGPIVDDHGDDRATATPIAVGVPVAGAIEEDFDRDVFSFPVEAGKVYSVEVQAQGQLIPGLVVQDASGQTLATAGFFFDVQETPAVFQAPATGTLFVQVEGVTSFEFGVGGPGTYELVVRGPFEDHGDTVADATPLPPSTPVNGHLPVGDQDVFSFTANRGEVFVLQGVNLIVGTGLTLDVLDKNGSTVLATRQVFGGAEIVLTLPSTGTYFVRLSPLSGSIAYRLLLRGPVSDDHGDTLATATPLVADGSTVAGFVDLPTDVDVFSFEATAQDLFLVELTDLGGTIPVVEALDANGVVLGSGAGRVVVKPDTAGTYFARVRSNDSFSFKTGPYRIGVSPVVDDHGDWAAEATLIPPDLPAQAGQIDFVGDADFFAFHAIAGETFTIKVGPRPFTGQPTQMKLQILDVDGTTPLGAEQGDFPLSFVAPSTGRFFLRLRSNFNGTYQLTLGRMP